MPAVPGNTLPPSSDAAGAAAFFDVDNTLMRGASLFHVARKMYQRRAFTLRFAAGLAWKQIRFIMRGETLTDVNSVRDAALALRASDLLLALWRRIPSDELEIIGNRSIAEQLLAYPQLG